MVRSRWPVQPSWVWSVSGVALGFDVSWSSHHHVRAPFILSCLLPQSLLVSLPSDTFLPQPLSHRCPDYSSASASAALLYATCFTFAFSPLLIPVTSSVSTRRLSLPLTRTGKTNSCPHHSGPPAQRFLSRLPRSKTNRTISGFRQRYILRERPSILIVYPSDAGYHSPTGLSTLRTRIAWSKKFRK